MNDFLLYLLNSTLCLTFFYLLFRALLQKETFFKLSRIVLLTIVICSMIIPLVILPKNLPTPTVVPTIPIHTGIQNSDLKFSGSAKTVTIGNGFTKEKIGRSFVRPIPQKLLFGYLTGCVISFLILMYGLIRIGILSRKARMIRTEGFRLLIVKKEISAFSLGHLVFISRKDYQDHGYEILTHEQEHIRLNHFYDLIFLDIVKMIYWFNPVIYLLIRDIKDIHEYQADNYALNKGINATQYQLLIIQKGVGSNRFALANSFNQFQIKKRIIMMNKQKSGKTPVWKVAAFLPMLALLLMAFGRQKDIRQPLGSKQPVLEQKFGQDSLLGLIKSKKDHLLPSSIKEISYTADDKIVIDSLTKKIGLYKNAEVRSKEIKMRADSDEIHRDNNFVYSNGNSVLKKVKREFRVGYPLVTGNFGTLETRKLILNESNKESSNDAVVGKVILSDGRPIQRLAVRIKGTDKRVLTDQDGCFKLEQVPRDCVLEFINVGLNTCLAKPDFEHPMNIKMELSTFWIDRVKVIGHTISNTTPKPLPKNGFASRMTVNPPIFIVNGVIATKNQMDLLEPDDVAAVNIVRGKSATDKYGPMAKNGAMEITTRKKINLTTDDTKDIVEVNEYADNQNMDLHHNNVVEEMPEFKGGMKELMKFLADNMKYPDQAKTDLAQGDVLVNFVINPNGKVEQVEVAKEVNPVLAAEVIRVISSMPDWNPGKQSGNPVDVFFTIPIQFSLQ
jgi:TonB family protein